MNWDLCHTFTVTVDVFAWMRSTSEPSKHILLSFLEDIASSLDFTAEGTAAALVGTPVLWFTFANERDAQLFTFELERLYNQGGWLTND